MSPIRAAASAAILRNMTALSTLAGRTTPLAKDWNQASEDVRNSTPDQLDAIAARVVAICERLEGGET